MIFMFYKKMLENTTEKKINTSCMCEFTMETF